MYEVNYNEKGQLLLTYTEGEFKGWTICISEMDFENVENEYDDNFLISWHVANIADGSLQSDEYDEKRLRLLVEKTMLHLLSTIVENIRG